MKNHLFYFCLLLCSVAFANEPFHFKQPLEQGLPAKMLHPEVDQKNSTGFRFEENKGQWPASVQFKADLGQGRRVYFENDRFTYVLHNTEQLYRLHEEEIRTNKSLQDSKIDAHAFQMKFRNALNSAIVTGVEKQKFHVNYYLGSDESKWASAVAVYSQINYTELYQGISIRAYEQNEEFKYDYIIAAGAKAEQIAVDFEGLSSLRLKNSTLYLSTSAGELVETIPYSYQYIDGKKVTVKCEYRLNKTSTGISFFFPDGYDSRYELVIDPVVMASTYSGSTANTYGHCATYDKLGNIYTGGRCFAQGYPATLGAYQITFGGNVDIAISKLNPTGSTLLYATYLGGNSADYPHSMYVNNDELFIYGSTTSTNFPTSTGCFDNSANGQSDMIVSKFNSSGTTLMGSTYVGGSANDGINNGASYNYGDTYRGEIIVNSAGDPYITGTTNSTNFPVTTGAYDVSFNGGQDASVFKMNSNLTSMTWATFLGSSSDETSSSLRLNTSGEVYIVGLTSGTSFPATTGALNTTYLGGTYDGYVAQFNSTGSSLINCTYIGTSQLDIVYFVDLDFNSDVYIYGISTGAMPVTLNVYNNPNSQTFVMKINPSLSTILYSTVLGGGQHTTFSPSAFMVDLCQNVYLSGWGSTNNYPITTNAVQSTTDNNDFHLMVISSNAVSLVYGTYYGAVTTGEHVDGGTSRFDPNGLVYQGVCECGKLFPVLPGSVSTTNKSNSCDIAVFKIDFQPNCNPLMTNTVICYGSVATLSLMNFSNLTNPTYSIQPGGFTSTTPIFTVAPLTNSTYTLYVTGTNYLNAIKTNSGVASVTVTPQPVVSPTFTQSSCSSPSNAINLGLSFLPNAGTLTYTVNWNTIPFGIQTNTQLATAGGIVPGPYSATIQASNGCKVISNFTMDPAPAALVFNVLGPKVITCADPTLALTVSPAGNSYTWTGNGNFTGTMAVLSATNIGNWVVNGVNPISGCTNTQTFLITQNITPVISTVTPLSQIINCSITAVTTVSASGNPSVNISHYWMSPFGGTLTSNAAMGLYNPGGPGTYTHVLVNNVNGCSVTKVFTVTSSSGYPTFSVTSPQNFTLGCFTRSVITIDIINAQSTPSGAPVSYTILAPSSSQIYTTLPLSTFTNVNEPGTYTIITKDNTNQCQTKVEISVIQNTFAPTLSVTVPRNILNCDVPTTLLQALSTTKQVGYNWSFPGQPSNLASDSIRINVTSNVTSSLIANFTLTITDKNNTCISTTVIPMMQNLFKPNAVISGDMPLTCKAGTITLTNQSTTKIPSFFSPTLPVIGYLWTGPTPQQPRQLTTTYVAATPGTYTLLAKDLNNGCTAIATKSIDDFRDYPIVNQPDAPPSFTFDCAANGATIYPIITSPTAGLTYTWLAVPNTSFSTFNQVKTVVNNIGSFNILVYNPANGCSTMGMVEVILGELEAKFSADAMTGFAPLAVNFTNQSASSSSVTGTQGIISTWSFGNGTSLSATTASVHPSTVYTQPGSYSVTLFVNKGSCEDTTVRIINVEIPSILIIPNVFTPNNDGVNDLFFVKAANLTEISAVIHDRWGHKVYDLKSTTGNIEWNGKNQLGVEVAEGTYFYIIKATGLDGKIYDQDGVLTLIR